MDKHNFANLIVFLIHFSFLVTKFALCYEHSDVVICKEAERKALLSLKQNFDDPSNRLSSWIGNECCKWRGVGCSNSTGHIVRLDLSRFDLSGVLTKSIVDLKHLDYLDLSYNHLGGARIPKYICSLTNLRYLNLYDNGFSGNIPRHLGNLTRLQHLNLGSSLSTGDLIVDDIDWMSPLSMLRVLNIDSVVLQKESNWAEVINLFPSLLELHMSNCGLEILYPIPRVNITSLLVLDLSWNFFVSPDIDWFSSLSSLQTLDLSFNDFATPIPVGFRNMTNLRYLDLSSNKMNSSIPDWMYELTRLGEVHLSSNNFRGTISSAVSNLSSLALFYLPENGFEGEIPASMRDLCSLKELDFSFNKFTIGMSGFLGQSSSCIARSLESLNLATNSLTGTLPDRLGEFISLSTLSLANNSFSGPIPESLGRLSLLRVLNLYNNRLTGNVPKSLGGLSLLEQLDISFNLLEGVVSEVHFSNLTRLKTFLASSNKLNLRVSSHWVPPTQLEQIGMRSWNLGTLFPTWIKFQKNCWSLDLSNAGLSDVIPPWFWNLSQIQKFNFSFNNLHGGITELPYGSAIYLRSNNFSGPVPRIRSDIMDLDLSINSFEGSLSPILCGQVMYLRFLDLSQNKISGKIPDCWNHWPFLIVLRLGNNNLTGRIPSSMSSLVELQSLHLRKNGLIGSIPAALRKCTKLKIIDLAENKFSGRIPSWIGKNFLNLTVLAFRSNKLHGSIPSGLCHLKSLQILDLANNNISGIIPRCIGKLTSMANQQKSGGRIAYDAYGYEVAETASLVWKGVEYVYGNTLALVTSFDVSQNAITGVLPEEITNLYGLLSLNLSRNHLEGSIPQGIGNMNLLESVDLSVNNMSGVIPQSMENMTFLSHLILSYNNFSGKIPSGGQLQSFDVDNFAGNPNLCGLPLPRCEGDNISPTGITPAHQDGMDGEGIDWIEMKWFYFGIPLGFVVGFWSVLLFFQPWNYYAYNKYLDFLVYKITLFFSLS